MKQARQSPPPDTTMMAELLVERYPIRAGEKVMVRAIDGELPRLELVMTSTKNRYLIGVEYLRGANGRDVWTLVTDALDALFGMLIESDRSYRDLPAGTDIELDRAFFQVEVERTIPELVDAADRMLDEKS